MEGSFQVGLQLGKLHIAWNLRTVPCNGTCLLHCHWVLLVDGVDLLSETLDFAADWLLVMRLVCAVSIGDLKA